MLIINGYFLELQVSEGFENPLNDAMSIASSNEHFLSYQNPSMHSTPLMPRGIVSSSGKVDVSVLAANPCAMEIEKETSSNELSESNN